ncbi:MAG: M23 family metallopeptidase [Bacteroidales bacterium]|nr:M23 family metallopeptidase [Bacteroidales bacterium]
MAKKTKYHFDPISLTYEIIHTHWRDKLKPLLWTTATGSVFAAVVLLIAYNFFSSPKERVLDREIDQYKLQFSILNDRLEQLQKVTSDLQNRDDNIYRIIFEAEPIPSDVRKAGIGGADRYSKLEGFNNSEIVIETTKKIDQLASQLYVQSKSYDDVFKLAKSKELMMLSIPAIQPVNDRDIKYISSYFGFRIHPIYKRRIFHEGIDYTSPIGTKVYATGDGVVSDVAYIIRDGFGKKIIIDHGFGYQTIYAHLNGFNVRPGQKVKRGDYIGTVGNTGLTSGPHLHYEVVWNNRKVNPVYFMFDLDPARFKEIIEQSTEYGMQ